MTKSQKERKVKNLKKEILYYEKVYPKSEKIIIFKSMYKHYKKALKLKMS